MKFLPFALPATLALLLGGCASPSGPSPARAAGPDNARHCIKETGTHLPRDADDPRDCVASPGQSYSREDIERTGEIDTGRALRKLSPSVQ